MKAIFIEGEKMINKDDLEKDIQTIGIVQIMIIVLIGVCSAIILHRLNYVVSLLI